MIYIQSDSDRNLPHHFDAACALYGAEDLALPYRLTSYEELLQIWKESKAKIVYYE